MAMDPEKLATATAGAIKLAMRPLVQQITVLERRCTELESRPKGLVYHGTWSADTTYVLGDTVTDKGSMWTAMDTTRMRPGESRAWQLSVKGGRDGRDGKDLR